MQRVVSLLLFIGPVVDCFNLVGAISTLSSASSFCCTRLVTKGANLEAICFLAREGRISTSTLQTRDNSGTGIVGQNMGSKPNMWFGDLSHASSKRANTSKFSCLAGFFLHIFHVPCSRLDACHFLETTFLGASFSLHSSSPLEFAFSRWWELIQASVAILFVRQAN